MIRITDIQESPCLSALSGDQQRALAILVGYCEGITTSGVLGFQSEMSLRRYVIETCNAFGMPTKAERAKEPA